jgi:hypothetical protein
VQGLLPGIDESEVRRMLAEVDLEPPDDLIDWFGWHNGYAPPPNGQPFWNIGPWHQAIGLEPAYDIYTELRNDIDDLAPDEDTEWFPVINFTHNGYILMYCGDKADQRGQVACWSSEFPDRFYRPATLAEPIEWWTEYLDNGSWRYDSLLRTYFADIDRDTMPRERRYSGMV